MEITKARRGLEVGYRIYKSPRRMKKRVYFLENYSLFTAIVLFTLTFSIINIILIMNFFKLFSNF